jgi:hypothetical protein
LTSKESLAGQTVKEFQLDAIKNLTRYKRENAKYTTILYNFNTTHSQWSEAHTREPQSIVSEGCVQIVLELFLNHVPYNRWTK